MNVEAYTAARFKRRRWLQYSLRMMLLVIAVGVVLQGFRLRRSLEVAKG